MKTKFFNASFESPIEVAERTFRFCFSDGQVDLEGDRFNSYGWDLKDFEKNPVALYDHDTKIVIGRASNLDINNGKLLGDISFAPPEVSSFADEVYKLVKHGYIKGVSVGFIPIDYEYSDNPKENKIYSKQKLLEISITALPANPRALIEMAAKGINVSLFKTTVNNRSYIEEELMSIQTLIKQVRKELARLEKAARITKDADGDNDGDEDREMEIKRAHVHFKAAETAMELGKSYHGKGIKCLEKCFGKSLEEDDDTADDHGSEDHEEEKSLEDDNDSADDNGNEDHEEEKSIAQIRARARARVKA